MKKLAVWIFLVVLAPMAGAEPQGNSYSSHGYAQFGAGGCSIGVDHWRSTGWCGTVLNLVGGGEGFVYKGLAIGGEGGWGWISGNFDEGVGMFSVNPAYHFKGRGRSKALVPFVTAGYTMLFRDFHVSGFNVGGGATWWPGNHVGLRFEGRVHHFGVGPLGADVFMFRIGPSLR
jgi:hypothetical protein